MDKGVLHGETGRGKEDYMQMKEGRRQRYIEVSGMADQARGSIPQVEEACREYIARLERDLQRFHVERDAILRSQFTAKEVAESAIERLRALRHEEFVNGPILHHMRQVQGGLTHAWEIGVCKDMLVEQDAWRIIVALVTEDDIRAACAKLPPGLSPANREKALSEIDAKIAETQRKLEAGITKEVLAEILG